MIFSEIYSLYYRITEVIINRAIEGKLTKEELGKIIRKDGFAESEMFMKNALASQEWPLITDDMKTPLKHHARMPLTTLEKRFLKTISQDPRFKLFGTDIPGLEEVEPLYEKRDIRFFDSAGDGDPFEDEEYVQNFKLIGKALSEKKQIKIEYTTSKGKDMNWILSPRKLQYSTKEDRFRLICGVNDKIATINLSGIKKIEILSTVISPKWKNQNKKKRAQIIIYDKRNAMERATLHFANYDTVTKSLGSGEYLMDVTYNAEDETELVIRVMGFGPMARAMGPVTFVSEIESRIKKQKRLRIF